MTDPVFYPYALHIPFMLEFKAGLEEAQLKILKFPYDSRILYTEYTRVKGLMPKWMRSDFMEVRIEGDMATNKLRRK